MSFENYKINKVNNLEINWNKYRTINPDLAKAGIVDTYGIIRHWFNHAMNEGRDFTGKNENLCEQWRSIYGYLRDNNYESKSTAFIVSTCVYSNKHLEYLKQCIRHIRNVYPDMYIYVINDSSTLDITAVEGPNIEIIPALYKKGGEINPYFFILDPMCKHDKLVYIHDSVFIKCKIDQFIDRKNEINFLWYALSAINNDTFNSENSEILDKFYLYCSNGKISLRNFIHILKGQKKFYYVKFGSMSVFTKRFMEKIDLVTNFKEVAHLFNMRVHRCFFERLISILYIYIYGSDYNFTLTLCGDIFKHPRAFSNTDISIKTLSPLVKVWQGR
jgi:hypothetical protein